MLLCVNFSFVPHCTLSSNTQHSEINEWRITGKIIRTTIRPLVMCTHIMEFLQFSVKLIFVFCVSVKVKLSVYCKV